MKLVEFAAIRVNEPFTAHCPEHASGFWLGSSRSLAEDWLIVAVLLAAFFVSWYLLGIMICFAVAHLPGWRYSHELQRRFGRLTEELQLADVAKSLEPGMFACLFFGKRYSTTGQRHEWYICLEISDHAASGRVKVRFGPSPFDFRAGRLPSETITAMDADLPRDQAGELLQLFRQFKGKLFLFAGEDGMTDPISVSCRFFNKENTIHTHIRGKMASTDAAAEDTPQTVLLKRVFELGKALISESTGDRLRNT